MKTKLITLSILSLCLASCETKQDIAPEKPVAEFIMDKNEYAAGEKVLLQSTSSFESGELIAFDWDFGDGSTRSTKENPVKVYAEKGTYTITLTVTAQNGEEASCAHDVIIREDDRELTADFSFDKESYFAGETAKFTDLSTFENGEIVGWEWDFGTDDDTSVSNEQNPSKLYEAAGDYIVTLTVTTDNGRTKSCQKTVKVSYAGTPPSADFSWSPENIMTGLEITFNDMSSDSDGQVVSWLWDFGDGTTSELQNPVHIFNNSGDFEISLTVTDDQGISNSITKNVSVKGISEPVIMWSQTIESNSTLRGTVPSIGPDGSIYVTSDALKLYAYSPEGHLKWTFDLAKDGAGGQQKSSACVDNDGTVYILSGGSDKTRQVYLYAINPDGTEKWKYTYPSGVVIGYTSPAIHVSGNIIVGNQGTGGAVKLIDRNTGEPVWSTLTVGGGLTGMIASDKSGQIYFGLSGSKGYGVADRDGGLLDWNVCDGYDVNGTTIAIDESGNTYAAVQKDSKGIIMSYDCNGNKLWEYVPEPAGKIDFSGPVLDSEGTSYTGVNKGDGGQIVAIAKDGNLKWKYMEPNGFGGTPAIDCYGNIHCGDNAGYYHVIRPDGTVLFKEQIGTNIWSSPVIADNGIIYINLKDGSACKLLAIDMGLDGPSDSCWPQRACNAAHTALQK